MSAWQTGVAGPGTRLLSLYTGNGSKKTKPAEKFHESEFLLFMQEHKSSYSFKKVAVRHTLIFKSIPFSRK